MRPGSVEGLVPDGRLEALDIESAINFLHNILLSLLESLMSNIFCEQIHFMYQAKDSCLWRQLIQSIQAIFKLRHIMSLEILAGHIKHVDEYLNIFEDVLPLALKELLHKEVLASAIPQ